MIGSCGESNTRCIRRVSSTTPRLGPRCPPVAATLWIRNCRISSARSVSCGWVRCCRSAGPRICSSIPPVYAPIPGSVLPSVVDVGHTVVVGVGCLDVVDTAVGGITAQQYNCSQQTCNDGAHQHTDLDVDARLGAVGEGQLTDQ